jgi:hypothetical protein
MGTELPTKVMLGQTLVLMQMTFLNNLRKVGRLVLSRISCFLLSSLETKTYLSVCQAVALLSDVQRHTPTPNIKLTIKSVSNSLTFLLIRFLT